MHPTHHHPRVPRVCLGIFIAAWLLAAGTTPASAQYTISRSTLTAGHPVLVGGAYELQGTAGQGISGYTEAGTTQRWDGFWSPGTNFRPPTLNPAGLVARRGEALILGQNAFGQLFTSLGDSSAADLAFASVDVESSAGGEVLLENGELRYLLPQTAQFTQDYIGFSVSIGDGTSIWVHLPLSIRWPIRVISSDVRPSSGVAVFEGTPGRQHRVDASTDLTIWTHGPVITPGEDGRFSAGNFVDVNAPQLFLRAIELQP